MTELDAALVRRKLATIVRNLGDLAAVKDMSLEEYVDDRFRLKGTERLLQETVEAAVDANLHMLRADGASAPPDYFRTFVEAGRRGIVPAELAQRFAPSTGLRNRLVHDYDAIDDERILASIGDAIRDFGEYVAAVEGWLGRRGV